MIIEKGQEILPNREEISHQRLAASGGNDQITIFVRRENRNEKKRKEMK
jgi:hypothetical protein